MGMRETLTEYFAGERSQGFFWLGVGVVMLGIGLWLVLSRHDYRGAGWTLMVVAAIEIVVGVTGVFNEGRVAGLVEQIARDEGALVAAEVARMRALETAFTVMKCVEVAIFLVGAVLVLTMPSRATWYAVGVGLIVQGAAALTLESIAHRRNADYRAAVESIAASRGGT
jgi:hypothetical protein